MKILIQGVHFWYRDHWAWPISQPLRSKQKQYWVHQHESFFNKNWHTFFCFLFYRSRVIEYRYICYIVCVSVAWPMNILDFMLYVCLLSRSMVSEYLWFYVFQFFCFPGLGLVSIFDFLFSCVLFSKSRVSEYLWFCVFLFFCFPGLGLVSIYDFLFSCFFTFKMFTHLVTEQTAQPNDRNMFTLLVDPCLFHDEVAHPEEHSEQ